MKSKVYVEARRGGTAFARVGIDTSSMELLQNLRGHDEKHESEASVIAELQKNISIHGAQRPADVMLETSGDIIEWIGDAMIEVFL